MPRSWSEQSYPLLRPSVRVTEDGEALIFDGPHQALTFLGESAVLLKPIANRLDGALNIGELAMTMTCPLGALLKHVEYLADETMISDGKALFTANNSAHYLEAFFEICDSWSKDIFITPFWATVRSGNASKGLLAGWGTEFFHRVIGANEHNAEAVAHCHDSWLRDRLVQHFEEEHDHGWIFLKGLEGIGLNPSHVEKSKPLLTTRQLIQWMTHLARENTYAYTATYGIMHAPRYGQTVGRIQNQFAQLGALYPFAVPLFKAFEEHVLIDVGLGHEEINFERLCQRDGPPSNDGSVAVLKAVTGITRRFIDFFDGILQEYGHSTSTECEIPSSAQVIET